MVFEHEQAVRIEAKVPYRMAAFGRTYAAYMAASEALSLGYGGVSAVRRACGLSRKATRKGIREIQARGKPLVGRIRRPGAGRKSITPRPIRGWCRRSKG